MTGFDGELTVGTWALTGVDQALEGVESLVLPRGPPIAVLGALPLKVPLLSPLLSPLASPLLSPLLPPLPSSTRPSAIEPKADPWRPTPLPPGPPAGAVTGGVIDRGVIETMTGAANDAAARASSVSVALRLLLRSPLYRFQMQMRPS